MFHLSLAPLFGSVILTLLITAVLLVLVLSGSPDKGSGSFRTIRFLRLLLVLLTVFLLFRPSIVRTVVRPLPASIFCLLDRSESMSIADEKNNLRRFEQMKKILADNSGRFRDLAEQFDLRFFAFDRDAVPLTPQNGKLLPGDPVGKETALGRTLSTVFQETAGKRVPGILLFSDGTEQTAASEKILPQAAAFRFRDAGIPVYTVPLGNADPRQAVFDCSVRELYSNDHVYKGNELQITGRVRISGAKDREIPVEFYFENAKGEMEKIDRRIVKPVTGGEEIFSWRFTYVPKETGERKLSVSIPPFEKELSHSNNRLDSFVKVIDGGLRVLYLEGTRRFEQKYLRLALAASSEIKIDYRRPVPDLTVKQIGATEAERTARSALERKSLANDLFQPGKYNVYLLGDLDSTAFKKEELAALAARISEGAGLIVLAGERSLAAGGYADTVLNGLLPVELNPLDRIPLKLNIESFDQSLPEHQKIRRQGSFAFAPTELGENNYILRLDRNPQKSREIWENLPSLENIYRIGSAKPGASILVNAVSSKQGSGKNGSLPLLISQNYGLGRVTVFAADSTWKWRLGGFEDIHKKFWRQLVLWSAKLDEPPRGELSIELDKSRCLPGEQIAFRTVYLPKEGESADDLERTASVFDPNEKETVLALTDEGSSFTGIIQNTSASGDYRISAAIRSKATGKEIQKAHARFLVRQANPELDSPHPAPDVLENIASLTGGRSLKPEDLPGVLNELAQGRETLAETREEKISLYDQWPVFGIFVFLLSCEWIVRKRRGLV